MNIAAGTRLGRYEIRSKIGEGGMGEIYLARDGKLNRNVAIKVLPVEFSQNADRLQRFEQEAQAVGALNHPNILAVYDVGTHDDASYVVSELLEGESLKDRLNEGAISQRKAIDYAVQLAHGLAAAHDKGVVHRDLKPDNIFITKDDRIKILDFGIAKLVEPAVEAIGQTDIATRKVHTNPGTVLGTPGYMSPEQVRGRPIDHRSDIFSLGAVLYEILSGRRAFHGESQVETLNAILKDEPPELTNTNRNIPPSVERVVWHCLEKAPERRFQSATDIAFALESLSTSSGVSGETTTVVSAPFSGSRITKLFPWIAAALFLIAFLAALPFAIGYFRRPSVAAPAAVRFLIPPPEKADYFGAPIISPDGRLLVFGVRDASGKESLWIRSLDSLEARPLAGTELVASGPPFWSPDSRSIGFFSTGKLKRIDVSGGPVQTLCEATFAGGAWSQEGVILLRGPGGGLARIPATGGAPTAVTTLDNARNDAFHVYPYFLPDGRHFLYLARNAQNEKSAIFVGSLDSKETKFLLNADSNMAYTPPGYIVFARQQTLMAQAFDADKLQLAGEAFPIAERVGRVLPTALALFSVSETGMLIYRSVAAEQSQLAWFDRTGKQLGTVGEPGSYAAIRFSPDEKHIALQRIDVEKGYYDIWSIDVARGTESRLTFDPANDVYPIWSPDGSYIVFGSTREGTVNLYQKLSNGAGNDELLFKSDQAKLPDDWSPDGRYILYQDQTSRGFDLWVLPLFGERKPEVFLQTDYEELYGRFSPDGRWVAYASDASGKREVYVRSFPAAGGQWQISNTGGTSPHWRRDGKELFYVSPDKKLMAVPVDARSGTFEPGTPQALFDLRIGSTTGISEYDVAGNGQRFLVNALFEQSARPPLTVVMNWTADLKQ